MTMTGSRLPYLRADWFVAAAANPPLYHDLLQLPQTDRELEKELRVDVAENVRGERAMRAGFNGSGVSRNNRLIERHESAYGAYWKSYDFGGNTGRQNLFAFPLGPAEAQRGRLPARRRRDHLQPAQRPASLHAGRRQGPAHRQGADRNRQRPEPARPGGGQRPVVHVVSLPRHDRQGGPGPRPRGKEQEGLFPRRAGHDPGPVPAAGQARGRDGGRRGALPQGGREDRGKFGATEPIVALALRIEAEMDLKLAAAEVGLPAATLAEDLEKSPALTRILGPLRIEGGTVQRQVFTEAFADIVRELRLGNVMTRVATVKGTLTPPPLLPPTWKKPPSTFRPPRSIPEPLPGKILVRDHKVFDFPNHQGVKIEAVAFSPTEADCWRRKPTSGSLPCGTRLSGERTDFAQGTLRLRHVAVLFARRQDARGRQPQDRAAMGCGDRQGNSALDGHLSWVRGVQFSPDGKHLATGSEKIRLWEVARGQELVQFPPLKEWVDGLAFSPDGKVLASAAKSVRLWDTSNGTELADLREHKGPVLTVAFSPDGKVLASGSSDKTVILWDLATRKLRAVLQGHRDPLSSVAFTPDGKLLISVAGGIRFNPGNLGEVKVWDVATGGELASLTGHTKGVSCVAVSPDGRQAASAGWDRTIRLWDLPPRVEDRESSQK